MTKQKNSDQIIGGADLIEKLKVQIQKCLLLAEEDKVYWLSKSPELPAVMLESLLKVFTEKNNLTDTYLQLALAKDPEHLFLNQLKDKIQKLRSSSLKMEEKLQTEDADALLAQKLANL